MAESDTPVRRTRRPARAAAAKPGPESDPQALAGQPAPVDAVAKFPLTRLLLLLTPLRPR